MNENAIVVAGIFGAAAFALQLFLLWRIADGAHRAAREAAAVNERLQGISKMIFDVVEQRRRE